MALRMAKNILSRVRWSDAEIFLGLLDAVPNVEQDELYTRNGSKCYNSLYENEKYYSRYANLDKYFERLKKPQIFHLLSGAPVALGFLAHSFCFEEREWYKQKWVKAEHLPLGRCVANEGEEYAESLASLGIGELYSWLESILS